MTDNDTEPLTVEWPDDPDDEEQAIEAIEELRMCINEVSQHHFDTDMAEMRYQLGRLYVEWALSHIEDLDGDKHPYKYQASTDLKNIILRLD